MEYKNFPPPSANFQPYILVTRTPILIHCSTSTTHSLPIHHQAPYTSTPRHRPPDTLSPRHRLLDRRTTRRERPPPSGSTAESEGVSVNCSCRRVMQFYMWSFRRLRSVGHTWSWQLLHDLPAAPCRSSGASVRCYLRYSPPHKVWRHLRCAGVL